MKIIKHGKKQEKEKDCITFECKKCGCEFKANKNEYHEDSVFNSTSISYPPIRYLFANCPECYNMCQASKKEEVLNYHINASDINSCKYSNKNSSITYRRNCDYSTPTTHKTDSSHCCTIEYNKDKTPKLNVSLD